MTKGTRENKGRREEARRRRGEKGKGTKRTQEDVGKERRCRRQKLWRREKRGSKRKPLLDERAGLPSAPPSTFFPTSHSVDVTWKDVDTGIPQAGLVV